MNLPNATGTGTKKSSKEDRVIATFEKNSIEKIMVKMVEWNGQNYIDIRVWYTTNGKEYLPGKKGITLNMELMPRLINALEEAGKALKEGDRKKR